MEKIDPQRLQQALNGLEADIALMRLLLGALLDAHPQRAQVLQAFRIQAEGEARTAPPGVDPEFLVEMRARLQLLLQSWGP